MKKLILKTTLFTFCGVLLLISLIYGIVALASPISLAKMFDGVGNYSISMHYYEKNYEKNKNLGNLYTICSKVDEKSDSVRAEKYLAIFTADENFTNFCKQKDTTQSASLVRSDDIFYGKYVVSIFYSKSQDVNMQLALEKSIQRVLNTDYREYNPFNFLLVYCANDLNLNALIEIQCSIESIYNYLSGEGQVFANADLEVVEQLISNLQ